jgi:hypothetical protein
VVSIKYGAGDFFRGMDINPILTLRGHKKIVELQSKREYDFFGEFPYYTGFEYEGYYNKIKKNPDIEGVMVWCQTGGWGRSDRVTFLENSSPYVELTLSQH